MAKTDTKQKDTKPIDHGDIASKVVVVAQGPMRMRLPYPPSLEEYAGIGKRQWQVLVDSIFPGAQTIEAICMAVAYCKERKLDIMKKPVHIVPMWSSAANRYVETVWPSIAEIRITATRTGAYAGKDEMKFGPEVTETFRHEHQNKVTEKTVTYPEWAELTVYRMVQGVRCAFVGPKVKWLEAYATENNFSLVPNSMWADRTQGQLDKCAEAASLRAAFPEELGNEYAAEEMEGRTIEGHAREVKTFNAGGQETVSPALPKRSDFERGTDTVTGEKVAEKASRSRKKKVDQAPAAKAATTAAPQEPTLDRGKRLLGGLKKPDDVADLHQSIMEELRDDAADDDTVRAWTVACEDQFLKLGGTPPGEK